MKKIIFYIPILFFAINVIIYLVFKFIFLYDLNRRLYYEFHTEVIPILILINVLLSILFFIILYLKKEYEKMYYSLIPILLYLIIFMISLIIIFK